MPKFIVVTQVTVSRVYSVDANSQDEAFEKLENGEEPETVEGVELKKTSDIDAEVRRDISRGRNNIRYAVEGSAYGIERKGDYHETWELALAAYLNEFPVRFDNGEVLVLTMIVNGEDPEPVWEQAFFDYIEDQEIQVRSVRDPRDPSDQLVKG